MKRVSVCLAHVWSPYLSCEQREAKVNVRCCGPATLALVGGQLITRTFAWKGIFITLLMFVRLTHLRKYQISISFIATFFVIASPTKP